MIFSLFLNFLFGKFYSLFVMENVFITVLSTCVTVAGTIKKKSMPIISTSMSMRTALLAGMHMRVCVCAFQFVGVIQLCILSAYSEIESKKIMAINDVRCHNKRH